MKEEGRGRDKTEGEGEESRRKNEGKEEEGREVPVISVFSRVGGGDGEGGRGREERGREKGMTTVTTGDESDDG